MDMFERLQERLPTEAEAACFLKRVESATGLKAERLSRAAESAAEGLAQALKGLERRASRLEGFVERVSAQVESAPTDRR